MASKTTPAGDSAQDGGLYDQHRPASRDYYYRPSKYTPQKPPASYVGHVRRPSEIPRTDPNRVQSSVSSAESGSSGVSMAKTYQQPHTYWHSSSTEHDLVGEYDEKMNGSWSSPTLHKPSHTPSRQEMVESNTAVLRYIEEQRVAEELEDREDDHAIWVLFWMSCLDPIHSVISAVYTLLVVLTLTLVSPIRLCRPQSSFGDQIIRSLAPLFRNHLELMYAPSVEDAFTFDFCATRLVIIHLSAPCLSLGVMLAGWVSAVFWLFSIVMGNPDGLQKHDDGRDTVIRVRNWWEKFLLNALRN